MAAEGRGGPPGGSRRRRLPAASWELVEDTAALAAVVEELALQPRYALDTEFHRERTYFPKLALVQLAWADRVVLVDPLRVDVRPLAEVLAGPALVVIHAAAQDLEVLEVACGAVPRRIFDTQLAAGFVGLGLPSLSELHERELGSPLPKGDRLTDWLARPLAAEQLAYAAADVSDLPVLHERLSEALRARGRLEWALEECEQLRARMRGLRDPDEAWNRIREVRQLRGRALAIGREVAAWRERRAAEVDLPTRHVLPDLAVAGVAQRAPATETELRKVRGVEDRFLRAGVAEQLLDAVRRGLAAPAPPAQRPSRSDVPRELRAAVGLLTAWVAQRARDLGIDASLLATRADLEDLLRGGEDARLAQGWRAELVGAQVRELLSGRGALAFDRDGGLRLEARSYRALGDGSP